MVLKITQANNRNCTDFAKRQNTLTSRSQVDTSSKGLETSCMESIRKSLGKQNFFGNAAGIILASWKSGTKKQYATYIKRWEKLCGEQQINPFSENVNKFFEFLTHLYENNPSYSAINTARAAISSLVISNARGQSLGAHPLVCRFMKGLYNLRPTIWNVSSVLNFLVKIKPVKELSLKDLTFKCVMLILLFFYCDAVHKLSISNMTEGKSSFSFCVQMKQSRQGYVAPLVQLKAYPVDRGLCIYTALKEYLHRTESYRSNENQDKLFISYRKPYKAVTKTTISRWVKSLLMAGIDVCGFKPHSTRAATTFKAALLHVPLDTILQTAGWSQKCTFRKYYDKLVTQDVNQEFADKILGSRESH